MSSFSVIVTNIRGLYPIEGADRIECASVTDNEYRFVVAKGSVTVGQQVLYIPLDAIIPDEVLDKVGLKGKLGGHAKNRVKTIKLKGQISQGLVVNPATVGIDLHAVISKFASPEHQGEEITKLLGIVKYDEEERQSGGPNGTARVCTRPSYVAKYDIENAEKYAKVLETMLEEEVWISEKLEGSHYSASYVPPGEVVLCSRSMKVEFAKEGEAKSWYQSGHENSKMEAVLSCIASRFPVTSIVTIHGEVVGPTIQKNLYKLDRHEIRLFDIEVNQKPITAKEFLSLTTEEERAPTVFIGKLKDYLGTTELAEIGPKLRELSNGLTVFGNAPAQKREGIVIKLLNEERHLHSLGRVFLKQRSPLYLAGSDL